jgi:hypothetical protein
MTQGAVLFMATTSDYRLTALLLFTTAAPRLIWPYLWGRGRRGADIVVWYKLAFWLGCLFGCSTVFLDICFTICRCSSRRANPAPILGFLPE